jgi:hypothetical protein
LIIAARAAGDARHSTSAVDPKSFRRLSRSIGFKSRSAVDPVTRDFGEGSATFALRID